MSKYKEEDIRRMTFGRFAGGVSVENNIPDEEIENDETRFIPLKPKTHLFSEAIEREQIEEYDEQEIGEPKQAKKGKKKRKKLFGGKRDKIKAEPEPVLAPLWTGQTTALDVIAPSSVDNGSRDYIVVDGVYHAYLYIAGYGYRTRNEPSWLSPLVEAGDSIGLSFTFKRMQKDKILSRISQKTMINRSKMREVADTRSDFEELDSAINSGMFLKEGMNRENQDFYYMSTIIEVTAEDEETIERNVQDVITLCASMDMVCKRADYKHEQGFLSALPVVSLDADLERKSRRNVLTDSLAAAFPFSSFEIYDPEGIFLGLNKYNNSVAILDIFDADKYSNANACIFGMTGAGKTFLLQLMALRFRQQGIQIFIIAPLKGHEYADLCERVGGRYIRIAASSNDCINIMEIRKRTLDTDYEIHGDKHKGSILAAKIQDLMIFFSLVKEDITQTELNLIDGAIVRTYNAFGITYDNESLFKKDGKFKKMPTLKDLYNEMLSKEKTKDLALIIEKFAVGSLSVFGGETNVDLDNPYIVLDTTEMNSHLKALGMFIALDFVWDKVKESRLRKKVVFLDELWTLIGAAGNSQAAEYVLEIFKVIRGYGGSAIASTQDISDFFSLDDGKYGKAIVSASTIKFILQMHEEEAFTVQNKLSLSDEEIMQVIRSNRGEALLCANRNKLMIDIVASPYVYDLITTKRKDLEQKRRRKEQQEEAEDEQSG